MVSKKPRKQRKRIHSAPVHARKKFVSAHLARELAEKFGKRSLPVRKGDKVRILRGDFKNHEGNVTRVDRKKGRIYVEGVTVTKADGTAVPRPVHPSNVMIIELAQDKWREKILKR
ncbi:MAG: 50S ribosomal protein L24 [Candidatus Hadarchaeales archaeon]